MKQYMKDILMMAAFSGLAYLLVRKYREQKRKNYEAREFLHFQLF